MVEIANNNQSKAASYLSQPRSLHINWMRYNVTDENVCPNTQVKPAAKLSPLRQKLQAKAD